jgi:hypothetical protein
MTGPGPVVAPCGELAGGDIVNTAGDRLGHLEQILIDPASGRIDRAVLACGGVFGIGARFVTVPWSDLALDGSGRGFVLDLSRENLERLLSSYAL